MGGSGSGWRRCYRIYDDCFIRHSDVACRFGCPDAKFADVAAAIDRGGIASSSCDGICNECRSRRGGRGRAVEHKIIRSLCLYTVYKSILDVNVESTSDCRATRGSADTSPLCTDFAPAYLAHAEALQGEGVGQLSSQIRLLL